MLDTDTMNIPIPSDSDNTNRKNLQWLFVLRNLMIGTQAFMILLSVHGLEIPLNQIPLWGIVTLQSVFNWWTWLKLSDPEPTTHIDLFIQLAADVITIAFILYFTGGASNPIAWFFLLPLIIAATVLPQALTWYLVIFASGCYTILIGYYQPLPELSPEVLEHAMAPSLPTIPTRGFILDEQHALLHAVMEEHHVQLHAFGMWFGFVFSAALVAYFVTEMAENLRERERRLAEVREQALRNERVVALGTLAAGAAHEMGTPLGTMAILIHELEQEFANEERADLQGKMRILREQVKRCKKALAVMSASAGEGRAEEGHAMPLPEYLDAVVEDWKQQNLPTPLSYYRAGTRPVPSIIAEQTLTHALVNILNNAAEVSPHGIRLEARWTPERVTLDVIDRGPGVAPELSTQIGKSPVTTKEHGLGVGLFLAFATIERLGGAISMATRVQGGTRTRLILPLLPPEP